jgi:ubiquinone/menaquinone biosynthesis C-methylase UbiE
MTELSAAKVKAFFDDVASDWDTMRLSYYDERVVERMASAAGVDPSMTVADVGTGTGFVAAGIASRVARVVGVDASTRMLAVARRNLAALGIRNVELRQGDVTSLPLADDSVDAAFANMVLHHAEDPPSMLAEMRRVVRPGGAVAICDAVEHPYAWMREEHADVWLGFTAEQVTGWFTAIGLERLSVEALGMQ